MERKSSGWFLPVLSVADFLLRSWWGLAATIPVLFVDMVVVPQRVVLNPGTSFTISASS